VITIQNMFARCNKLKEIDLSSFNTPELTNMDGAFWDCHKLQTLKILVFDTSKIILESTPQPFQEAGRDTKLIITTNEATKRWLNEHISSLTDIKLPE